MAQAKRQEGILQKSRIRTELKESAGSEKSFTDESLSANHFKYFNLRDREMVRTGQNLLAVNASVVHVSGPNVRVTAIAALAFVANIEIVSVTEGRTIRAIVRDGMFCLLLFENAGSQIMRIL
jgi:hypothetical protein